MPVIKAYFIKPHTREEFPRGDMWTADDVVYADDFQRFKSSLFVYDGWRDEPARFGWTPDFPAASHVPLTTLSDEALYESNYRVAMETFSDNGVGDIVSSGHEDTFYIEASHPLTTHAIATAQKLQEMGSNYPVLDDEDYSDLEFEKTKEAFEDYGRSDLVGLLCNLADDFPFLDEVLDTDEGEIRDEFREVAEPLLDRMAFTAVSYSGEMYFGYVSDYRGEHTTNVESLNYCLGEVVGDWQKRETTGELLENFVATLKHEKTLAEEAELQKVQPPIEGIEIPPR
jgi:hypothetical protein